VIGAGFGYWSTLVAVATLLVGLLWWLRAAQASRKEMAVRPPELVDADLLYSERRFEVREPVHLSVRLDRAYLLQSGLVVLMELKTRSRSRVFPSDVVQLSAQRLALERATRQVVASHGYVVAETLDGKRKSYRVRLLSDETVVGLIRRREAILAGQQAPGAAVSPKLCVACAYRNVCPDHRAP
jgi:CRISPR-associated exonuclease Cas4